MEIIHKFENKLLKRIEIKAKLTAKGATPSRQSMKDEIAKVLKTKPDLVVIVKAVSSFGSSDVLISANVYESEEVLKKLTPKHIMKRGVKETEEVEA